MKRGDAPTENSAPNGTYLCYGDVITFEVKAIEGCPTGGFLGSEDVSNLIQRLRSENHDIVPLPHMPSSSNEMEERFLGIRASQGIHPPEQFYQANIFQVIPGFGFEAAGEPVKFGSQIKLRLKTTGEVLRSSERSNMLQLMTSQEYEHNSGKECNFRIGPRYETRAEGDLVYFHDLVVLRDFMDRSVYCTSSTKVIVAKSAFQVTGFYLSQYVPNQDVLRHCIVAGDVIQLYHKEERCFVMANTSYITHQPEHVTVCKQDEIVLPNASSFWQLELVEPGLKASHLKGTLQSGTSVRLKHLTTDKYLTVIDDRMALNDMRKEENIFELRLNFDYSSPTFRDYLECATIGVGSGVRIYHPLTKSHITLKKDATKEIFFFQLSKSTYDKDVFQTIAVPPELVDTVFQGKKFHRGLSSMLDAIDAPASSTSSLKRVMTGANSFVKALISEDKGYLSRNRSGDSDFVGIVAYNTCFELGLIMMLFQLAARGFRRVGQIPGKHTEDLWKEEEMLVEDSYTALGTLLKRSRDTKRPPIPRDAVSLMVSHLKIMGYLGDMGKRLRSLMPLTMLIDAIHDDMASDEFHESMEIMTPKDLERLLDTVEHAMKVPNEVPDPLPWNLLARICNPMLKDTMGSGDDRSINKRVQVEICRQILGSPYAPVEEAPAWSLFFYRTSLLFKEGTPEHLNASSVMICTSPFGQCRPAQRENISYIPVRPPSISPTQCDNQKWNQIIKFRNANTIPSDRLNDALFQRPVPGDANQQQEYHSYLADLLSQVKWQKIDDLSGREMELFRSMIDLLASLCAGRNLWTQRVVRRVFPVDTLLTLISSIEVVSEKSLDSVIGLLPLKTSALLLLHECYINSAAITPIPSSGKDAMRAVDYSQQNTKNTWEEALVEECATKVFGVYSQVDFFDVDITADMTIEDLDLTLQNIELLDNIELNRAPHPEEPLDIFHHDIASLKDEYRSAKDIHAKRDIIKVIQSLYREELFRLCTYAMFQRNELQRLIEHFVTTEASTLWDKKIQAPILKLCCTDNQIYGGGDLSVRFDDTKKMKNVTETSICINYFNGMLHLLRSLLLRQFFDPDYNTNKVLSNTVSESAMNRANSTRTLLSRFYDEQLHSKGKLSVLRDVAKTFLDMLSSWPGDLSAIDLSDDERSIEECFKRIFGYIKDSVGFTEGVVGIKLQCCNLLSICLDIMHVSTSKELRRIFDFMVEYVCLNKKKQQDEMMRHQSASQRNMHGSDEDKAQEKIIKFLKKKMSKRKALSDGMSKEELKAFRMKVWTELHVRVVRDPDMLWNESLLFKKNTFHTLLHMVLYADAELRAEALHILYRINSHQSELVNYMLEEFELEKKEETPVLHYVKWQKFWIKQILNRFDRFFDVNRSPEEEKVRYQEMMRKDNRLLGHILQLKKLLLSNDETMGGIGLINFIFQVDVVKSEEVVEKKSFFKVKKGNHMPPQKRVTRMSGSSFAYTLKDLFVAEKKDLSLHTQFSGAFHGRQPNHIHQFLLRDYGIHTIFIDFLDTNVSMTEVPTSLTMPQELEIVTQSYRLCIWFIRAFTFQNMDLVNTEISPKIISTLLRLRFVLEEAVDFVIDLIKFQPKIVEKIGLSDFCSLLEDVKSVAGLAALNRPLNELEFNGTRAGKFIELIQLIILSEVDSSRERLNIFVSLMQERVPHSVDSRLFVHRILKLGLKLKVADSSPAVSHVDVRIACNKYQIDTGRISFSRLPKDVLGDPIFSEEVYAKYKTAMKSWKLLSDRSVFKFHLDMIGATGICARCSPDLQSFCQEVIPKMTDVLQVLMIDKYEIRLPYLKLFHGVWFGQMQDLTPAVAAKIFEPDTISYLRALLFSFAQDFRLFLLVLNDQVSRTSKAEELGHFPAHIRLMRRYISEAVVPFYLSFVRQNLHILLDTISPVRSEPIISSTNVPVEIPSFKKLTDDILELIGDIVNIDASMIIHDDKNLFALDSLLQSSDIRTGPVKLVIKTETFAVILEKANQKASTFGSISADSEHTSWRLTLRRKCLPEFVLEVDQLAKTNGYTALEHMLKVDNANVVYVNEREVEIPNIVAGSDVSVIAQSLHASPIDIIRSPLNAASFRFALKEISKILTNFTALQYKEECDRLIQRVNDLRFSVEQELLPNFDKPYRWRKKVHIKHRFWTQYERWNRSGGVLLECIFSHMLYSVQYFRTGRGMERTTITMDDLCQCNAYWCNTFTRGLLRSRMDDISQRYGDQTELFLDLQRIEEVRRRVMQHVFEDLNAVDIVVQTFSAIDMRRKTKLTTKSLQLMQSIAMGLGTAINEGGNLRIQTALIDHIQEEYERSITIGNGDNFLKVARKKLREYSRIFLTKKGTERSKSSSELQVFAEEVMDLLRFFSLLCEGHNGTSQEYLGRNNLVSDIATFVSDLGKLLATEMRAAMLSDDDLHSKFFPTILDRKRAMIKWVSPSPFKPSDGDSGMNKNAVRYEFIDIERIKLLSKVMAAGLEALSEFCQGPRPNIQVIIARAGATKDFSTFFNFFGAFHFAGEYSGDIFRTDKQKKEYIHIYQDEVRYSLTHQAMVNLYPKDKVMFLGNCPLASALVQSLAHERGRMELTVEKPLMSTFRLKDRRSTSHRLRNATRYFRLDAAIGIEDEDDEEHEDGLVSSASNAKTVGGSGRRDCVPLLTVRGCSNVKRAYIKSRLRHDREESDDMEKNHYSIIIDFEDELVEFEKSCLKFAMSLLEGTNVEENTEVPKIVVNDVGESNLVCNMANYWQRFLHYSPVDTKVDEKFMYERDLAYDYYGLVMRILDTKLDGINELIDLQRLWLARYPLINVNDHIARIEVRYEHEKNVAVTYYPIPKIIKQYWNRGDIVELRDQILFPSNTGTRDSADEKVKNYIKDGRLLIDTLRHLDSLDETYAHNNVILFLIIKIAHNMNRWSNISFLLALTVNILVIMSVKSNPLSGNGYYIYDDLFKYLVSVVGLALVCSTGLTLISYMILYGWLYVKQGLKNNPDNEFSINNFTASRTLMTLNRFGLIGREKAVVVGNGIKFRTWSVTAGIYYLLSKQDSWYYMTLLVFALVGYLVTPATYCICMVEVLRISKLMQYVSRAFTENIDQVVATVVLAMVIMYLFVNVSFAFPQLHNRYTLNGIGEAGCYSLETCLRLHLDYGMLQSILWQYDHNIPTAIGEVYNFFLTFIMQIVIPGLISGIIIDTFSEMRNAKQQIEGDVFNNCFICNIARDDFEAAGMPFEQHIKNDHNMWKYLWFLIYLDEKDHTEFDGIEQFCATLDAGSTRWLPIRKARALSNMRERYDLFTLYQKISSLQSSLDILHTGFKADLNAQEKTIREIVKSENQDMEKGLRDLDDSVKVIRKVMGKKLNYSHSSGSSSSSDSDDELGLR
jgi:hypothetical protein